MDAVLARMNAVLGSTKGPNGEQVQVAIAPDPTIANYAIDLTNGNWLANKMYDNPWGLTSTLAGINVYVDNIKGYPTNVPVATNIGNAATHELGHGVLGGLFGTGDVAYDRANPNTMMLDQAGKDQILAYNDPNSPLWKYSPAQMKALYDDCLKKNTHKPQNGTGTNGGAIPAWDLVGTLVCYGSENCTITGPYYWGSAWLFVLPRPKVVN